MSTEVFYPGFAAQFTTLLGELREKKTAVIGHARPDGDCIGSQVALVRVLRALGAEAWCVNADLVPRRLQSFVDDTPFILGSDFAVPGAAAIYVDCADQARAGDKLKARFPQAFANIDHHLSNVSYGAHNFVDVTSAATCEILAGMMLDQGVPIDAATAQALYVGILTDTGQFRFNSTSRRTFRIAAELLDRGAKPALAGYELYERESHGRMKLLQHFLSSLRMECKGRVCVGVLPGGIFDATGTTVEDTEGLVDYARSINGVDVGVLIEERPNAIKASLRAKDPAYRLDQVAGQFSGGGHACAAGLNLKNTPMDEFYSRLIAALERQIQVVDASKAN